MLEKEQKRANKGRRAGVSVTSRTQRARKVADESTNESAVAAKDSKTMLKAQRAANESLPEEDINELDDELSEFDTAEPAANDNDAFADDEDAPDEALLDDEIEGDLDDDLDVLADAESEFLPELDKALMDASEEAGRCDVRRALEDRLEARRISSDFDYLDID